MNWRDFIKLLGGVAVGWPLAVRARNSKVSVIGLMSSATAGASEGRLVAFREGLKKKGFVEGRNVIVEYRWAAGDYQRLSDLSAPRVGARINKMT